MVIKTKLNVPTLNKEFVPRENIAQKLDQARAYKVVLVTAPAGYGKTTAVAGYLWKSHIPHAWLSIDESDNDPAEFWRYLVAALADGVRCPDYFADIPVNKELISSGILAGLLVDRLYGVQGDLLIVLDDYHLIHGELIQKSLAYFIKYLPKNITVILLSRKGPDSKLSDAYARGQVLKIGVGDLSFGHDEIAEFFSFRGFTLQPEEIPILHTYTEGWAAGLVVAALSMAASMDVHKAIRQFSGRNRYIDSFINDELFDHWPDEVKELLVQTSFLDKLCGPLCDTVTGNENSGELLMQLAKGNSLVLSLDDEDKWFRHHHLFREFLEKKLSGKGEKFLRDLRHQAGVWYRENGLSREAIDVFIKAGSYEEAFALLVDDDIYLELIQNDGITEWYQWAYSIPEGCPEGYLKEKVQGFSAFAWVLAMDNRLEEAAAWLDKAQAHFESLNDADEREKQYLKAHILMGRAAISLVKMDTKQLLNCFMEAASLEIYQPILLGELNPGETHMLNTLYGFKGRLRKIDESYLYLTEDVPRIFGDFSSYLTVILAECQYERDDLNTAYQTLTQGMERILALNNPGVIVPCFLTLARMKRARGDMQGAFRTIAEGAKKLGGRNKAFWNYYFNVFTADLYIDLQDAASAEEWLDIGRIGIYDGLTCSREYEYIVFARYLTLQKKYDDAIFLLHRLEAFSEKENRLGSRIRALYLLALCHHLREDTPNAMPVLEKTLELGMEHGYIRTFIDELEPAAELLSKYMRWKKKWGEDEKYRYVKNLFIQIGDHIKTFREQNPAGENAQWSFGDMAERLLSPREYNVLRLLAAGRTNSEIAAELCITVRTVKHHNSRIFEKLGVRNRHEAVKRANETGMLK